MQKEELYEEIDAQESLTQKYLGLSLGKFFLLLFLIIMLGIYLGIILYGTNSYEVLSGLEAYEDFLHGEVSRLKEENAELQRQYFELKEISAQ